MCIRDSSEADTEENSSEGEEVSAETENTEPKSTNNNNQSNNEDNLMEKTEDIIDKVAEGTKDVAEGAAEAVTDVAELKFVIFAIPSPIRTNLFTSVETKVLADAVIVTEPVVPLGVKVVVEMFVSKKGPLVKSTSVNVQDV